MENFRKSLENRSREPDPKKPRLLENDRYTPQNLQQQEEKHRELIDQYKSALSDLTFNSKPIITNLTIIAGENLLAAREIAATICDNIIEVPTELKLPSLYLLDSIVKNHGRDYRKHFSSKLPEVFCTAYREADSSIRSSMKHLFGTWKAVFHPELLQMIEKELGFAPTIVNASSVGGMPSRSDSQTRHLPQTIHVNPMYLEARQRLQQSSQVKGPTNDISGTMAINKGAERPGRASSISGGRPWADLPINVQRSQREASREYDNNFGTPYGDHDYGSELSTQRGKSWKSSEEDKYMWDDHNPKYQVSSAVSNSTKVHFPSESEKQKFGNHPQRSQSTRDVIPKIDRESSFDSLVTKQENRPAFINRVSPVLNNYATGSIGQQRIRPSGDAPQPRIPMSQKKPSPILSARDPRRQLHSLAEQKQSESLDQTQKPAPSKISKLGTSPGPLSKPRVDSSASLGTLHHKAPVSSNLKEEKVDQLPLQPKPRPSSIMGNTSSQTSGVVENVSNPLSDLFSSLIAKGLVTSSNKETSTFVTPQKSTDDVVSAIPNEALITESPTKALVLDQTTKMEVENEIGLEFKPEKIRKFHPPVISDLFDDLPHQCSICGLRFKLQERLDNHLECHDSEKSTQDGLHRPSRSWFVKSANWVDRKQKSMPEIEPISFTEQMVPADESQCICFLCGELFEDFYCQERDMWMFRGAMYMPPSSEGITAPGLIVHTKCASDIEMNELMITDTV